MTQAEVARKFGVTDAAISQYLKKKRGDNSIIEESPMYPKFIINQDGVLKFGRVYLHKDLLQPGEQCVFGGGLWKIDEGRRAILLYGRSFDFGPPYLEDVRRIDWSGVGGRPLPLFFLPHWPSEDVLEPVYARR